MIPMTQIRFAIVGSGWRSLFYWRVACAYPHLFHMTGMLCRTQEKADRMAREYGVPTVVSEQELEAGHPDFIVVAVNKASICAVSVHWLEKGFPVLCETPAAMTLEELRHLWRLRVEQGARLQVAEQYCLYPSFAAGIALVQRGYLKEPYSMDISAAHDYHAASLIRRYLGVGMEQAEIFGRKYRYPVEETDSRYGAVTDGTVKERERTRLTFAFAGGKTAFYDFDGVQYHSYIRSRHLRVQGQCGELDDAVLRYVDGEHRVHEETMAAERCGASGGIARILLGDQVLYENPFRKLGEPVLASQDETAIGTLLLGMETYLRTGKEVYPLAEALQDAYFRILMDEVCKRRDLGAAQGQEPAVRSAVQPWNEPV